MGVAVRGDAQAIHLWLLLASLHTSALRMWACTRASQAENKTEKPLPDVMPHIYIAVFFSRLLLHCKSIREWWLIFEVSTWTICHLQLRFPYLGGVV